MKTSKIQLWLEQVILFIVFPILLWRYQDNLRSVETGGSFLVMILPIVAVGLLFFMKYRMNFSLKELGYLPDFKKNFLSILKYFIPSAVVYTLLTYFTMPTYLFFLPRKEPDMWMLIMFFYPIMSVVPQGIIYRLFYFKRYAKLFNSSIALIVANGLFFCFAHIMFNNFIALAFTFVGGMLFAWRYNKTQSLLISALEHAMYGNLLFTIGIGRYLVSGMT